MENRVDMGESNAKVQPLGLLILLTLLFIIAQVSLFLIHYKVSELVDALVNSSVLSGLFHPVVLWPIIAFIMIQLIAYVLLVGFVWFVSISLSELLQLSPKVAYWVFILYWMLTCTTILALNQYYYPDSFFATLIQHINVLNKTSHFLINLTVLCMAITTVMAYINFFRSNRHFITGSVYLLLGLSMGVVSVYDRYFVNVPILKTDPRPNIILIGIDSLRPDFIHYFGNPTIHTPHIDQFLQTATTFTNAYTPLARTFPSWISILTAKYPKHSGARNNLVDPKRILQNDTMAKKLQHAGYETIYATDEKRFSNITEGYGFDRILGPHMGVNDFLLGGLSDFPLTNLLINLPMGRWLFPYNYANRAAAITYEPDKFIALIKHNLAENTHKPVFFAIHLCISHWPFTFARDAQPDHAPEVLRYQSSIEALDQQLGVLLDVLKTNGMLQNSLVVLLSDHGTALGLPNDRVITKKNYLGDEKQLKLIPVARLSSANEKSMDFQHDFVINTAYGQGTDVLSLKQNHVLLAFKQFDHPLPPVQRINALTSLLDIAPTILEWAHLAPLQGIDGVSLVTYFTNEGINNVSKRAFFIETGDKITEIETDHIYIEQVIKHEIGVYQVNPATGLLFMRPPAEESLINNKERAILLGDWLLARYPASSHPTLAKIAPKSQEWTLKSEISPAYYVLVNIKTGRWTVGFSSPFAKHAPLKELRSRFENFFKGDMI